MSTNAIASGIRNLSTAAVARSDQISWTVIVAAVEMSVIAACAYAAFVAYSAAAYGVVFFRIDYVQASVALAVLYGAFCIIDNQYDLLGPHWNQQSGSRGAGALGLSFIALLTAGYLTNSLGGYSRGTFLAQLLSTLVAQISARFVLRQLVDMARARGRWLRESMVVLVMPGARGTGQVRARLAAQHEHILRWYDFPVSSADCEENARSEVNLAAIRSECRALPIDAVLILFGSDNMDVVSKVVEGLSELPVRIQLLPMGLAELMQRSRVGHYGHLRVLELFCGPCSLRDRLLKRSFDLVVSAVLLALLWPFLLVVAAMIKLESQGPVLFKQVRHGFNNEPIIVLKFRSMACQGGISDEFCQAVRDDPRVTRLGRVLRRTNIDELPQLLNVLRGDMSLVGPRPHALAHNDMFAKRIDRMFRRHNVKPGMTGWAQVNGLRGETDTVEKMQKRIEHDLHYVDNWSFVFDLKILVATVISKQARLNAY